LSAVFGLDVGTSAVKGLAVAEDGAVVASAEDGYGFDTPRPGWSEQDPERWWTATERVLAALRRAAGDPAGIGLSGQMHGLVALDARDRVLRPAILWNDQRTAEECREIEARLGEDLLAITGNQAVTGFTAPKLLWMARHEPDLHARIRSVLLPKDYVRLRLDGERTTDVTDASGTLWLDVRERAWSERVLAALEVDPGWLPPVLESVEVAGAGDQGAGAAGVGAVREGTASVVLGTSGVVLAPRDRPEFARGAQASAHVVPGRWFSMGVILSAAGSLRWLRDVLDAPYDVLLAEAERRPPACEGLTFLPYLTGERAPHNDPDATGAFAGLTVRHDRGALVRAVLEGVAFALRDALDLAGGEDVQVARVSGGGARSPLWLRIAASALGAPLERVAVEEGAAYGAALLGGVRAGVWGSVDEAVDACVRVRETVDPVPAWADAYAEARERYRALYPALRSTFLRNG
jgi:xylulokinase